MATDRQDENVPRVRRGIEAFNRGDAEAGPDFFDEGIEIYSTNELVNPGNYRGHNGYMEWVTEWLDAWDDFTLEVERIEPVGEHYVAVGVRQTGRGKESGIPVDMSIAYMFELGETQTQAL